MRLDQDESGAGPGPRVEHGPSRRPRSRRRAIRLAVVLGMLGASAAIAHRPLFLGNVGEVDPGRVIRSAQPKGNLDDLIAAYRPASILNLRGGSYADDWYAREVAAARRHGIDFYDFPMKATDRPSRGELLTLLDLMERCRYPLLIHCKSGADRTGLACGLYRLSRLGQGPAEAEGSFSIRFGHFPIGGPERLHEPFDEYRRWLDDAALEHSPERFHNWVERHYRDESGEPAGGPMELLPGPRMGPPREEWLRRDRPGSGRG